MLRSFISAIFLIAATTSADAQNATVARDPAAFRDSLLSLTDVTVLARMERTLDMPGSARSLEPILERGLIAHRIFQITGDREDAARARDAFKKAIERFPDSTWSHYGYAISLADGPETRLKGVLGGIAATQTLAELMKKDPRSKARNELRTVLARDPSFGDAAVLLADLAVADGGRNQALVREARDALQQTRAAGATGPAVSTALARMETQLGNPAAAAKITDADAASGDALALKTQAQALLLQPGHEEEGGRAYARAIQLLTPQAAAAMYADVQVLVTSAEAAEWKRAKPDQQQQWLTRFWSRRAADAGVPVADRLATHYRRLAVAQQRYVRNSLRGSAGNGTLTTSLPAGTYPFDQRGVMYVRHGEPVTVVSTQSRGVLPNETWVYNIPDAGAQIFHFAALRGASDFVLISDITKAIDPAANLDDRNRALITLLQDRIPFESTYQTAAMRIRSLLSTNPGLPLDGTDIRNVLAASDADYRKGARETLKTDSYRKDYDDKINYVSDVFTFRTPLGRTEITAAFAVPVKDVQPMAASNGTRYALNLSLIVLDTLLGNVTRRDTSVVIETPLKLEPADYLRAHITMPVVPTQFAKYRLVVEDVVSGNGETTADDKKLKDYANTDRLLISDIVLAAPDSAGDWQRGAQHLALALPRTFEPSHPFTVFYEIYNLQKNEPFTTHIAVTPLGSAAGRRIKDILGSSAQPIQVSFDAVAATDANNVQQEVRQLASSLPPGRYRITVEVTGSVSHRTATADVEFTVTK
jgi:GWxTD domain-containing protein